MKTQLLIATAALAALSTATLAETTVDLGIRYEYSKSNNTPFFGNDIEYKSPIIWGAVRHEMNNFVIGVDAEASQFNWQLSPWPPSGSLELLNAHATLGYNFGNVEAGVYYGQTNSALFWPTISGRTEEGGVYSKYDNGQFGISGMIGAFNTASPNNGTQAQIKGVYHVNDQFDINAGYKHAKDNTFNGKMEKFSLGATYKVTDSISVNGALHQQTWDRPAWFFNNGKLQGGSVGLTYHFGGDDKTSAMRSTIGNAYF